ncbi:MAG: RagB/SusD family nutrient uptake outer membrane protein [Bacteroidaceae bacterium]
MKNKYIKLVGLCMLLTATSCNDFLDTLPDSRTTINTPKQVSQLLLTAYPNCNYSLMCELSSDNFEDNNAPNDKGVYFNLSSKDRIHDEIFAWEEAKSSNDNDSPSSLWEGYYNSISVTNQILVAIDKLIEQGTKPEELMPQKGEALLCRAYAHFMLVNLFAQAYINDNLSATEIGIPYITAPETIVFGKYEREPVATIYKKIEADLLAGLSLISDNAYSKNSVKYHFTKKAAQAFASRFYLYKRDYPKVVEYATEVLGKSPLSMMRDYTIQYSSLETAGYGYINPQENSNLLLIATNSTFSRVAGSRYGCHGEGFIHDGGPTWNYTFHPCFEGLMFYSVNQDYGSMLTKVHEMFEYTDKVAGIGYPHIVRAEFTAEETLLCRAEAYIYLNKIDDAVADFEIWNSGKRVPNKPDVKIGTMSKKLIQDYYVPSKISMVKKLHTAELDPQFIITPEQEPFIQCLLHLRRIETAFEGLRWFDIKRYGIEIEHKIGTKRKEVLKAKDYRKAFQIPQEVIGSGMQENLRNPDDTGENKIVNGPLYTGK